MPESNKEKISYEVGKMLFIVTPVYKENGETIREILWKLMRADLERA